MGAKMVWLIHSVLFKFIIASISNSYGKEVYSPQVSVYATATPGILYVEPGGEPDPGSKDFESESASCVDAIAQFSGAVFDTVDCAAGPVSGNNRLWPGGSLSSVAHSGRNPWTFGGRKSI
jgi:hypothetical protein